MDEDDNFTICALVHFVRENGIKKFLMLGLISSMVIASLCQPMLYIDNRLEKRKHFILDLHYVKFIGYWVWLLGEIVKSTSLSAA